MIQVSGGNEKNKMAAKNHHFRKCSFFAAKNRGTFAQLTIFVYGGKIFPTTYTKRVK